MKNDSAKPTGPHTALAPGAFGVKGVIDYN